MRATEVGVYDWVHCITDNKNCQLLRVNINDRYIADDGLYADIKDLVNMLSDIEGIPLSKEILEMNEYKVINTDIYSWEKNSISITIGITNKYTVIRIMNLKTGKYFEFDYSYRICVHKFQHILRDCDLFDLADNFKMNNTYYD